MTVRRDHISGTETDMGSIRERFGGADPLAGLLGTFTALGVLVFVAALIAAGDAGISYQLNQIQPDGTLQEVEVVGSIVAIAVIFASFLAGGWAAGRMARYDGAVNGVGAALWFVLLVAIFGAIGLWFGDQYNAFAPVDLPNWFAQVGADELTLKSIAGALAGIVAALLGGGIGGKLGEQYHKDVDAALAAEAARSD
jgi:hypothetical protein